MNSDGGFRRMVLFVMFDMPTKTRTDLRNYTVFKKRLFGFGFFMFQYSVYIRFCENLASAQKYEKKIQKVAPSKGHIIAIKITESQYKNMVIIKGKSEKNSNSIEKQKQLVMVF